MNTTSTNVEFEYDEVLYPSFVFPQMSPDRLATMATLFGITVRPAKECRMLELGCGDGTNLLSIAYSYPDGDFVGIDLGEAHIKLAKAKAKYLGLTNVRFICADISNLAVDQFGVFDYIAAHGLFSWVPDSVRSSILTILNRCLSKNGIGYLSFNVYPGCHIREITNNLMKFHTLHVLDPNEKVGQGKDFLKLIIRNTDETSVYNKILRQEFKSISERTNENVFHDDLSDQNKPYYFTEFLQLLDKAGMKYLRDANPAGDLENEISAELYAEINGPRKTAEETEQYLDMISMRRFRTSLFCRIDCQSSPNIDHAYLAEQFLSTKLKPVQTDDPLVTGYSSSLGQIEIGPGLTNEVLKYLSNRGISGASFEESVSNCGEIHLIQDELISTRSVILRLFENGAIKISSHGPLFVDEISESPEVSAFARMQVKFGSKFITTLAGENLELKDDLVRCVLFNTDGKHSHAEIAKTVTKSLGLTESENHNLISDLPKLIDSLLDEFMRSGLLTS